MDDSWAVFESKQSRRRRDWVSKHPFPPVDPVDRPVLRGGRRQFQPPLVFAQDAKDDPFLRAVNKQLRAYNNATFAAYANPLGISTLSDTVRGRQPQAEGVRLFALGRQSFMAKVPMFIIDNPSERQCLELMVRDGDGALTFCAWLAALPAPSSLDITGVAGYRAQLQWWKTCGKAFRFSDLPQDLQEMILLRMMGEVRRVGLRGTHNGEPVLDFGHAYDAAPDRHVDLRGVYTSQATRDTFPCPTDPTKRPYIPALLDTGVLLLDKRIYNLARSIVQSSTIKNIDTPNTLTEMLRNPHFPAASVLSRLQLDFTDAEYINFFKAIIPTLTTFTDFANTPTPAAVLLQLPNLRYLELWFHSTIDSFQLNPWAFLHSSPEHERHDTRFPCRKAIVEFIMCYAYQYIKHIPAVSLTGYIKTSTSNR